jgi:hypothetical protein
MCEFKVLGANLGGRLSSVQIYAAPRILCLAPHKSSGILFQHPSMRAFSYGAARFLLYRSGRAARIPRYASPIGPAGLRYAPSSGTQRRNLSPSPISNATADISESYRPSAAIECTTIYALSTTAGRAAIAVVRISGPACIEVTHCFQDHSKMQAEMN